MSLSRRFRTTSAKLLFRVFPCLALGLVLLRVYPRDLIPGLAGIYYLTPTPVISLFLLPAFFRALQQRHPRPAALFAIAGLLLAVWPFRGALFPRGPVDLPLEKERRIVFWTPDHYHYTTVDEAFAFLRDLQPDVIGMVEGNVDIGRQKRVHGELFSNYTMELLDYAMIVLHRGRTIERGFTVVGKGRAALSTVTIEFPESAEPVRIALYDQNSNPFLHRKDSLREAVALLMEEPDLPTLLMGDFNLPKSSLLLRPVRKSFRPTDPRGPEGLPHTYPRFLPLVPIDQVWTRGGFTVHDARLLSTDLGWHRPIVLDLTLPDPDG